MTPELTLHIDDFDDEGTRYDIVGRGKHVSTYCILTVRAVLKDIEQAVSYLDGITHTSIDDLERTVASAVADIESAVSQIRRELSLY